MKHKSYLAEKAGWEGVERGEGSREISVNFCSWYIVSQSTITSCGIGSFPCPLINLSYHMQLFTTKLTPKGTSSDKTLKLLSLVTEGP